MLILTLIQQIYQLAKLAQKYHKPQRFAFFINKKMYILTQQAFHTMQHAHSITNHTAGAGHGRHRLKRSQKHGCKKTRGQPDYPEERPAMKHRPATLPQNYRPVARRRASKLAFHISTTVSFSPSGAKSVIKRTKSPVMSLLFIFSSQYVSLYSSPHHLNRI